MLCPVCLCRVPLCKRALSASARLCGFTPKYPFAYVNVAVSAECPFAHAHHGALQSCPVCAPTRLSVNDRALDGPTS